VAEMAACSCVLLTNVVVRADPFQLTTELLMKPFPFTVRVKAAPPAVAVDGESEVMLGKGFDALIVNEEPADVPPPGAGLNTVTCAVPAVAMSVAEMAARSCELLTNVVVRADPFQLTTELLIKPLPFTVRVKAALPAVPVDGESEVMLGGGFDALIVNEEPADVPPPGAGLNTVTSAVPAVAISVAEMAARSCVLLTKVVVRADPFQLTTELLMKPLPFTVRVKAAAPAVAADGDREVTDGAGFVVRTLTTPPAPEMVAAVPSDRTPYMFPTDMGTEESTGEVASWTVTTATVPLAMV